MKKGLSNFNTMSLIIVVILASIVVFLGIYTTIVSQTSDSYESQKNLMATNIEITEIMVASEIYVDVKKNYGDVELTGLRFIFYYDDGTIKIVDRTTDIPQTYETKKFTFSSTVVENPEYLVKIGVMPYVDDSYGEETIKLI